MTVYLVTVNGKVSQEAYKTLDEAQEFIKSRLNSGALDIARPEGYYTVDSSGTRYEIHDVKVK